MGGFLLLGAGGLVGRHIREELRGRPLVVTYRLTPVEDGIELDLIDHHRIREIFDRARPEVVIIAAAEAHVEACEREPARTRQINVESTRVIAALSASRQARLVVFSSEYVFDGRDGPYVETSSLAPLNEYGRQKVEVESIVAGTDHLICRTSGVFGLEPARKNFVLRLVDRLREGRPFDVPTDQVITPTYAPSLARAVVRLIEMGARGTFHVVGPQILSRGQFALLITKAFGLPAHQLRLRPTRELGLLAERPRNAGLLDQKIRRTLGHGLTPPEEALSAMLDLDER